MKLAESENLELKKSTSELKDALPSISAMLNKSSRGEILFGIGDDGTILGQDVGKKTLREVSSAISSHIEPKIYPKISEFKAGGKRCIRVLFEGGDAPYFAYSRAYVRVADEDRLISAKELEQMFVKKNKEELRWDNKPCKKARLSDIDSGKLRSFLAKANLEYGGIKASLDKLGLLCDDGSLTNTAVLFFAKAPGAKMNDESISSVVFTPCLKDAHFARAFVGRKTILTVS